LGTRLRRLAVLVVALAVVAGVLAVIGTSSSPAHAAFPGPNGEIAFRRDTSPGSGVSHIFVMNPDGSGQTDLEPTSGQVSTRESSARPDGGRQRDWRARERPIRPPRAASPSAQRPTPSPRP